MDDREARLGALNFAIMLLTVRIKGIEAHPTGIEGESEVKASYITMREAATKMKEEIVNG